MKISKKLLIILIFIDIVLWIIQAYHKIYIKHSPSLLLWSSSMGLLFTTIALIIKRSFFSTSVFCALFVMEILWSLSFFSELLLHQNLFSITSYMFKPHYARLDFIVSLYHLLIVPSLIVVLIQTKKIHHLGWLGALLFTTILTYLAYLFPAKGENVNCVQKETIGVCRLFFSNLYSQERPIDILLGLILLTVIIFIPTNIVLSKLDGRLKN